MSTHTHQRIAELAAEIYGMECTVTSHGSASGGIVIVRDSEGADRIHVMWEASDKGLGCEHRVLGGLAQLLAVLCNIRNGYLGNDPEDPFAGKVRRSETVLVWKAALEFQEWLFIRIKSVLFQGDMIAASVLIGILETVAQLHAAPDDSEARA
jgi:hypothetical protein